MVFRAAKKLGGGLFGSVLNYIGIGMLLIVLGTISTLADSWFIGLWFNITSIVFFATGYIFMVIGANKLLERHNENLNERNTPNTFCIGFLVLYFYFSLKKERRKFLKKEKKPLGVFMSWLF